MNIDAKRFAWAVALVAVVLYILCALLVWIGGREIAAWIFNSLLHGVDVHPIMRIDIPLIDTLFGLLFTTILAWFTGFMLASVYNKLPHG